MCIFRYLPYGVREIICQKANAVRKLELSIATLYSGKSSYAKKRKAKFLGVCVKCARTNCTWGYRSINNGCSYKKCDEGAFLSGNRFLKIEFIRGRISDDSELLNRVCSCGYCHVCNWARNLASLALNDT